MKTKIHHHLWNRQINYEILYIGERNSLYSLLKKYEHNLVNRNNSNEEIRKLSKPKLCNIIKEEFNTLWQTQVTTFTKADTYTQFKNRVKFESYLADIKNRNHRVTFTKYKLSDHCLMIEKGRHKRPVLPREERFCPFCSSTVENEIHFLTQCSAYKNRNELFNMIAKEVPNLDNKSQYIFLISQENKQLNLKLVPTIHKWFTERLEHIKWQHWLEFTPKNWSCNKI